MMDNSERQRAITTLLRSIGEDPDREGLRKTPERVDRAYDELFKGYTQDPSELMAKTFEDGACDEMVVVRDIVGFSNCEHHILPFSYTAHVGYIPNGKVLGLSKIARLVELYGKRLQIQERMTAQIADTMFEKLEPLGVAVVIEGRHLCTMARGVRQPSSTMVTSALRGLFKEDEKARAEFLSLIWRGGSGGL
jgi:GTP cyclohydrolase I